MAMKENDDAQATEKAMRGNPSILVSWYTDPRAIPPFILSPGQVTVGPK
jgi:hypothetical protein